MITIDSTAQFIKRSSRLLGRNQIMIFRGGISFIAIVTSVFLISVMALPTCSLAEKITSIAVQVATHGDRWSGTDNDVHLVLWLGDSLQEYRCNLDNPNDNFERGNVDSFVCPLPDAQPCDIKLLGIQKSPDDFDGGWKLAGITIYINGAIFYQNSSINQWLHGDVWSSWCASNFSPQMCPPPLFPAEAIEQGRQPWPPCEVGEQCMEGGVCVFHYPDGDCDGIKDSEDNEWSPPDTDNDTLPDPLEKMAGTDPNNADTDGDGILDPQDLPDADQDCLADFYEDAIGTDKNNNDSDMDGWLDGACNIRTKLILSNIEIRNTQEDIEFGRDELFVTFNHMRLPPSADLDGYQRVEKGSSLSPIIEVARRTKRKGAGASYYTVTMDVREDDWFDWTDDDFILDLNLTFPPNGSAAPIEYLNKGFWNTIHYVFHFVAVGQWFQDPNPLNKNADDDRDGLTEEIEYKITTTPNLYGIADPAVPDIYMELDWIMNKSPERYTKEDICSRFAYHGYAFHLDDGVYGGGQELLWKRKVSFSELKNDYYISCLSPDRKGIFHYALAINEDDGDFGKGSRVVKNKAGCTLYGNNSCGKGNVLMFKADFLDHISDFESILWIHEFGHNLGLCHLPGDPKPVVIENPVGLGSCDQCQPDCDCAHYTNTRWDDSAMGSGFSFPWVDDIYQAIDREIDYDEKEWAVVDLTPISGKTNCPP